MTKDSFDLHISNTFLLILQISVKPKFIKGAVVEKRWLRFTFTNSLLAETFKEAIFSSRQSSQTKTNLTPVTPVIPV